ncbi:hypothetical protein [Xanthomonas perforans]|uniref:hypothetical protein n=1 Tax=Xanthomonas perforans TaxID=442694 RepID=UPI0009386A9C|nr:hypothetical protein [Xanthomonas perforans]APO98908.1 hypothetical protein BJD13_07330 [Xanthomonas perforans]
MSKRQIIEEIRKKNERLPEHFFHGSSQLSKLELLALYLDPDMQAARSLVVIGAASCIEVSVKEAIKQLVDFGSPFIDRVDQFKEPIKFDLALTRALSERLITFGDLVSHSLSVSNIGQIASHFEVLFSKEHSIRFGQLLASLRAHVDPTDDEVLGGEIDQDRRDRSPLLVVDVEGLMSSIARLFELRHLGAHEASFELVTTEELTHLLSKARHFIDVLYELVEQTLRPGATRSSFGASIEAMAKAGEIRNRADALMQDIKEVVRIRLGEASDVLSSICESEQNFQAFADAEVSLRIKLYSVVTGNALRNVESFVLTKIWGARERYLIGLAQDVKGCLE